MRLTDKLRHYFYSLRERREFCKLKLCCECRYFSWFHGSAGVCQSPVRVGCCTSRMKDCLESCDCGNFRKQKRSWRMK